MPCGAAILARETAAQLRERDGDSPLLIPGVTKAMLRGVLIQCAAILEEQAARIATLEGKEPSSSSSGAATARMSIAPTPPAGPPPSVPNRPRAKRRNATPKSTLAAKTTVGSSDGEPRPPSGQPPFPPPPPRTNKKGLKKSKKKKSKLKKKAPAKPTPVVVAPAPPAPAPTARCVDPPPPVPVGDADPWLLEDRIAATSMGRLSAGGADATPIASAALRITVALVPHFHSKYCDRVKHVCPFESGHLRSGSAAAATRHVEGEVLRAKVEYKGRDVTSDAALECSWLQLAPSDAGEERRAARCVVGRAAEYRMEAGDVRHFLQLECTYSPSGGGASASASTSAGHLVVRSLPVGPVIPGRPSVRDIAITGDPVVGGVIEARGRYFGIYSGEAPHVGGACQWWWMRVTAGGQREELPITVVGPLLPEGEASSDGGDGGADSGGDGCSHITYRLTDADAGARFKVRCIPSRADGVVGQTFTSRPTAAVTGGSGVAAPALSAVSPTVKEAAKASLRRRSGGLPPQLPSRPSAASAMVHGSKRWIPSGPAKLAGKLRAASHSLAGLAGTPLAPPPPRPSPHQKRRNSLRNVEKLRDDVAARGR